MNKEAIGTIHSIVAINNLQTPALSLASPPYYTAFIGVASLRRVFSFVTARARQSDYQP